MNHTRFRKLASGKIVKTVDEQYLRSDIPCGHNACPICDKNDHCRLELSLAGQDTQMDTGDMPARIDKIFIIDHHFALDQIDLIENCDVLSNLVIVDSVLKHMNKQNIQAFYGLRNTIE